MKKAIVIGASSGIGKGVAQMLAGNQYMVGITGRRTAMLDDLKNGHPDAFIIRSFDITDSEHVPEHLEALARELGGLDLLVLSSGTGDLNESLDYAIEQQTIDTNVAGFTRVAGWAFRYFEQQGYGHLCAITSIGGLRGSRTAPAYNATKAYQINYLEGLRQKAARLNKRIVVTDIRPGLVDTAMAKGEGLFWVMPVDKAVRQIYKAIRNKKKIAYVTKRWRFIAYILELLPGLVYERL